MKLLDSLSSKHHFALLLVISIGGLLFILVHHGVIHNGVILQYGDFDNAFYYLLKSHEGIILTITLVLTGIIIGHAKYFKR